MSKIYSDEWMIAQGFMSKKKQQKAREIVTVN